MLLVRDPRGLGIAALAAQDGLQEERVVGRTGFRRMRIRDNEDMDKKIEKLRAKGEHGDAGPCAMDECPSGIQAAVPGYVVVCPVPEDAVGLCVASQRHGLLVNARHSWDTRRL